MWIDKETLEYIGIGYSTMVVANVIFSVIYFPYFLYKKDKEVNEPQKQSNLEKETIKNPYNF